MRGSGAPGGGKQPASQAGAAGAAAAAAAAAAASTRDIRSYTTTSSAGARQSTREPSRTSGWNCSSCTYINKPLLDACEMCSTVRTGHCDISSRSSSPAPPSRKRSRSAAQHKTADSPVEVVSDGATDDDDDDNAQLFADPFHSAAPRVGIKRKFYRHDASSGSASDGAIQDSNPEAKRLRSGRPIPDLGVLSLGPGTYYCDSEEESREGPRLDMSKKSGIEGDFWWVDKKLPKLSSSKYGASDNRSTGFHLPSKFSISGSHPPVESSAQPSSQEVAPPCPSAVDQVCQQLQEGVGEGPGKQFPSPSFAFEVDFGGDDDDTESESEKLEPSSPKIAGGAPSAALSRFESDKSAADRAGADVGTEQRQNDDCASESPSPHPARRCHTRLKRMYESSDDSDCGKSRPGHGESEDEEDEEGEVDNSDCEDSEEEWSGGDGFLDTRRFKSPPRAPPMPRSRGTPQGDVVDLTLDDDGPTQDSIADFSDGAVGQSENRNPNRGQFPHFVPVREAQDYTDIDFDSLASGFKGKRVRSYELRKKSRESKNARTKAGNKKRRAERGGTKGQARRCQSSRQSRQTPGRAPVAGAEVDGMSVDF
jgi:hypothetical protein